MARCSACGRTFHTEKELQAHDKKMHRGKMTGSAERMGERVPAPRVGKPRLKEGIDMAELNKELVAKATAEFWRLLEHEALERGGPIDERTVDAAVEKVLAPLRNTRIGDYNEKLAKARGRANEKVEKERKRETGKAY